MAELAAFIIMIVIVGVIAMIYGLYRLIQMMRAERSRWRVTIRGAMGYNDNEVMVLIAKRNESVRPVVVGRISPAAHDFDEQLQNLIQKADAMCASMNAVQASSQLADRQIDRLMK